MSIKTGIKQLAFAHLSHRARLHIQLTECQTDEQKLLEAIGYNEPSLVKFYLDAGVNVNSETYRETSPLFHAAVMQNPLITKMLLESGANPGFEHKMTHSTILRSVFRDYDWLVKHNPVTSKLNNLVMIAALMRNAGQRFDMPNSLNELPMDGFGLWVGAERKDQVLAEFLEKIDGADINSIQTSDVVAQSPAEVTRLSPEEERHVVLYQEGRYDDLLQPKFGCTTSSAKAKKYFTHFGARRTWDDFSAESSTKRVKPKALSEETSKLNAEVLKQTEQYISTCQERKDLETLMHDESKDIKDRALAAGSLCNRFFEFKRSEHQLLSNSQLLLSRLITELDETTEPSASAQSDLFGPSETLASSTVLGSSSFS